MTRRLQADDPATSAGQRRLRERGEFLRLRRTRLDPQAVGLPVRGRRRTPGLRREDIAERAGVSTAWYTSLEQCRPIKPSRKVVAALSDALLLSDAERDYLFALSGHTAPDPSEPADPQTALLQQLVEQLDAPAYCTDALTNVLAWNAAAAEVFGDYSQLGSPPNLLRLLFEEPDFGRQLADRNDYAQRVVQTFRGRTDAYLNDAAAIDLVDSLARRNPRFKALWEARDVRQAATDTLEINHPSGPLLLTLVTLQGIATPGVRFNAYLPAKPASIGTGRPLRERPRR